MKTTKRVLSLFIILALAFSMSPAGVFASNSSMVQIEEEAIEADILSTSDPALESEKDDVDLTGISLSGTPLGTIGTNARNPLLRSPVSTTQTLSGYITNPTQYQYVTFSLAQNQVVQLTLQTPPVSTIDYDLYLYTFNPATGTFGNSVSYSYLSTFINPRTGKTVDEGIGYKHTSSAVGNYAAVIQSAAGSSTTHPFYLTVSIDNAAYWDAYEANDSPFFASTLNLPSASPTTYIMSGMNLNVPNDQDWILLNNPMGFDHIEIIPSLGHKVEIYYAAPGAQMKAVDGIMKKNGNTGNYHGFYDLALGANYIRIYSDDSSPSHADYTLTIRPYYGLASAAEMVLTLLSGDENQNWVTYSSGTKFRYRNELRPRFEVRTANGYIVEGTTIRMILRSSAYPNNPEVFDSLVTVNSFNEFIAQPRASYGTYPFIVGIFPHLFRHYVDIDTLEFTLLGAPWIPSQSTTVYRFVYSEPI